MVDNQRYSKAYLGSELLWGGDTILTRGMVSGTLGDASQRYVGTATRLIIDDSFPTDNLTNLFRENQTLKSLIILTDKFTNMSHTFRGIGNQLESLAINTSNVTNMSYMFYDSNATSLDLSSFNTSKVANMSYMFCNSKATSLNLSSFNTFNVITMESMFQNSQATTLDLSSFNTSKVTNMRMRSMFNNCKATTGYARTQIDAKKFNESSNKPSKLNFIVKR